VELRFGVTRMVLMKYA